MTFRPHTALMLFMALGASCSTSLAQSANLFVYATQTNGGPSTYSASLAFLDPGYDWGGPFYLSLHPSGTGTLELVSPGGTSRATFSAESGDVWLAFNGATPEQALAQMNGRWTLRYTDDDADWPQTDYFFDVAVNGITSSSLGRVEFTTPLPGTTVSPRPTLAYTSTFDTPDWAVVWNPAGDIDAAVNRSFTYTNPLRAGEYWFGALEGRDRLLAGESFTLTSAGQVGDGPSLALAAGQVQLSSYGFVTNVTVAVPAPSVLAVLGVGGVFAGRRRRSSPPLVSNR